MSVGIVIAAVAGFLLFSGSLGDATEGGLIGNILGQNGLKYILIGLAIWLMMKGGR